MIRASLRKEALTDYILHLEPHELGCEEIDVLIGSGYLPEKAREPVGSIHKHKSGYSFVKTPQGWFGPTTRHHKY